MKILGIETVTKIGSLAVFEDGRVLSRSVIDTTLRHNARFIPSLDLLLKSIHIDMSSINVIAVDIGPGSFTGIRVGIASAKGLAQPGDKELVGVCSLDVMSQIMKEKGMPEKTKYLVPVIDAKRGMVFSAYYKMDSGRIIRTKDPYLGAMGALKKDCPPDSFLFGPDIDGTCPDASMVAKLAFETIKRGNAQKNIEPLYLHDVELRRA